MNKAIIGIVTVSDRASSGEYEDQSGPALLSWFENVLATPWQAVTHLIPDERAIIEKTLITLCDDDKCDLIVTTGGTGPALRDVTPEATVAICHKILPGFGESMRKISLQYVPTAILSRQLAGIRGKTLVVNLPGQPKAIAETMDEIFSAIPYCIDLIGGVYIETDEDKCQVFRPKSAIRK